jgi:hypothetical protein
MSPAAPVTSETPRSLFDVTVASLISALKSAASRVASAGTAFGHKHPYLAAVFAIAVIVWARFGLLKALLRLVGFSATGPVTGSFAAAWQSRHGGVVVAGSAFALCQSVAMGGATVSVAIFLTAAAMAGFLTIVSSNGTVGYELMRQWANWVVAVAHRVVRSIRAKM